MSKEIQIKSSCVAQWVKNSTSIHEDPGSIPGLTQWVKDLACCAASCGEGHRCGSDPALLWLWLAAATPFHPLAGELPYVADAALKRNVCVCINKKQVIFQTFFPHISWHVEVPGPGVEPLPQQWPKLLQ